MVVRAEKLAVAAVRICDVCRLSQSGPDHRFCQQCGQPLVGSLVGPRRAYLLDRFVAPGYSSAIWHAVVERTGETRAVKVLKARTAEQRQFAEREAGRLKRLHHPRVPHLFEAFNEAAGDLVMLVLEHVDGPTMRATVEANGPLPLKQAIKRAHELAEVLEYLAGEHLVHLDVHPKNVLLHPVTGSHLIDFGIARPVDSPTEPGGRTGYFAPEVVEGLPAASANDVYALSGCLYFGLTGEDPPEAPEYLPMLSSLSDVPSALISLLHACRKRDPRFRPPIAVIRRELGAMLHHPDVGDSPITLEFRRDPTLGGSSVACPHGRRPDQ